MLLLLLPLMLLLTVGGSQDLSQYYRLQVPQSVTVEEGLCTSIPCTFSYISLNNWVHPSVIHGYWFKSSPETSDDDPVATTHPTRGVKKRAKGRFHLAGDPVKDNCSLSITDAQRNDTGRYFFRMERGENKYNYLHFQVHLNVTALKQKPDISIPEILEPERSVTLICAATWLCEESTNLTFSWIRASLSSGKPSRELPYFSELTLIPRPQDHGTNLTCQVTFPRSGVSTERTVQLNVALKHNNSWPLVLTLLRGGLTGIGFLLTYVFTCLYYSRSRCRDGGIRRLVGKSQTSEQSMGVAVQKWESED